MAKTPTRWRKSTSTAGIRKCLKCDDEFKSLNRFHRICLICAIINTYINDIEIARVPEHIKQWLYKLEKAPISRRYWGVGI
jgi:hypothetical protein